MTKLVVVESPAKAKTIQGYLGSDYRIISSYGHVRDLPSRKGSVIPEDNFSMVWESDERGGKNLSEIRKALSDSDGLILATDPDREGEAIAWHILEALGKGNLLSGKSISRVTFNAITKKHILEAMGRPRELDIDLVDSALSRRAIDYLVGFGLSEVLWRKLPGAKSAGRVQSVALRLVCDRESEIESFISEHYYSLHVAALTKESSSLTAKLVKLDGNKCSKTELQDERLAKSLPGNLLPSDGLSAKNSSSGSSQLVCLDKTLKEHQQNPNAPFSTSTLQQDANYRLGMRPFLTMRFAQELYEGVRLGSETKGLITYMRTDSVSIGSESLSQIRDYIKKHYGANYLPQKAREYKNKIQNAQEAHEAIRAVDVNVTPDDLARLNVSQNLVALYKLIWQRTVASQMNNFRAMRTTYVFEVKTEEHNYEFRTSGSIPVFDGFKRIYHDFQHIDSKKEVSDENVELSQQALPDLAIGDKLQITKVDLLDHNTEPKSRYSEASLIKKMEEVGIGRPSTYASTVSVLQSREYVQNNKGRLKPLARGRLVTVFLVGFFEKFVDFKFTASMEHDLDRIAGGNLTRLKLLEDFWQSFSSDTSKISDLKISNVLDYLNEYLAGFAFVYSNIRAGNIDDKVSIEFSKSLAEGEESYKSFIANLRKCPKCGASSEGELSIKTSRFGTFVGCSNYPSCSYTFSLDESSGHNTNLTEGDLGLDNDGNMISLRTGRYGPYLEITQDELEAAQDKSGKPRRVSIPKAWCSRSSIDLDEAKKLASLPRVVGIYPDTGHSINAQFGRFGAYLDMQGVKVSLPEPDDVFNIGINHAVELISDKMKVSGGGVDKVLGHYTSLKADIVLTSGRYGSYVKVGKHNLALSKNDDVGSMTEEQIQDLVERKIAEKMDRKKAKGSTSTAVKKLVKKASRSKVSKSKVSKPKVSKSKVSKSKTVKKVVSKQAE